MPYFFAAFASARQAFVVSGLIAAMRPERWRIATPFLPKISAAS